jgi:ferric-dicitrate binding protein FerR (iron transport regulator)
MESVVNRQILFEHFAGKSSPLQKQSIEEWLKKPQNQELFYLWLLEWETQHPQYNPSVENAFKILDKSWNKPTKTYLHLWVMKQNKSNIWFKISRIAAACLMIGLGSWYFKDHFQYQIYETNFGQVDKIQLADGTMVTLNANSTLKVPRFGFGTKNREVELSGEAVFSVTHTPDNQKFIVKTKRNFDVVVLGTEFSVFSRDRGAKVILNKGKVRLEYQENQVKKEITMRPGELVKLDISNHVQKDTAKTFDPIIAWQQNRLIFEDTNLFEFTQIMEENYGVKIKLQNDSLAKRTLVGSYKAQNAEELLNTVVELLDLKLSKTGNTFVLSEK